jgi:hypothetical protein
MMETNTTTLITLHPPCPKNAAVDVVTSAYIRTRTNHDEETPCPNLNPDITKSHKEGVGYLHDTKIGFSVNLRGFEDIARDPSVAALAQAQARNQSEQTTFRKRIYLRLALPVVNIFLYDVKHGKHRRRLSMTDQREY